MKYLGFISLKAPKYTIILQFLWYYYIKLFTRIYMIKNNTILSTGKKLLATLLLTIFISPLFAVDYSEMSTQELIAIMGYVEKKNVTKFKKELKSRVGTMSPKEKAKYQENLVKLKEK